MTFSFKFFLYNSTPRQWCSGVQEPFLVPLVLNLIAQQTSTLTATFDKPPVRERKHTHTQEHNFHLTFFQQ
jgi:hypothetical protein